MPKASPDSSKPTSIKVAAAQLVAHSLDQAKDALAEIEAAVVRAAEQNVDLLVLPECAYPAYLLGSAKDYRSAKKLKSKAFIKTLSALAKTHELHVVCGFVDDSDKQLRNVAVIIDTDGKEVGRYAKTFLWGTDNDYFEPGDTLTPFDTALGRIGVLICADGRAPEIATGLANQGAQLIVVPTCWVNVAPGKDEYHNPQAEFMIEGRASECGVPIVAANKCGTEGDTKYCGMSQIVGADGKQIAIAPPDEPALITGEVTLGQPNEIEIPRWSRRRIINQYEPILPNRDELGTVKIAVAPASCVFPESESETSVPLEELAANGTHIVGTSLPDPETADRLDIYCRALGMSLIGFPFVERLMIESFGACGCVESDHIASFAPMRIMALDGAAIVFVAGAEVSLPLLRTRAAENCIYIAAASENAAVLIDPTGTVIDRTQDSKPRIITAEIDLRLSADKEVYPNTHIWEQRKPELYAKAFGIKEGSATTS